jgi:hypothetical protein
MEVGMKQVCHMLEERQEEQQHWLEDYCIA